MKRKLGEKAYCMRKLSFKSDDYTLATDNFT